MLKKSKNSIIYLFRNFTIVDFQKEKSLKKLSVFNKKIIANSFTFITSSASGDFYKKIKLFINSNLIVITFKCYQCEQELLFLVINKDYNCLVV